LIHYTSLSRAQSSSCKVAGCAQTSYNTRTFPNLLKLQEPCTDLITCFVPVSEFTQYVLRYGLMLKQKHKSAYACLIKKLYVPDVVTGKGQT